MRSTHIIPYAFEIQPTLEGKISGGLPAVFAAEIEANRAHHTERIIRIISTDKQSMSLPDAHAEVIAADPSPLSPPFGEWFGNNWAILHATAHTSATCSEEMLRGMYRGTYHHPLGSLQQLVEHTDLYPAAPEKIPAFAARYRRQMQGLLSPTPHEHPICINWQDPHLFFTEVVKEHAAALANVGYVNTGHLHTSLPPPEIADLSKWWSATLHALSVFQSLYVHTEQNRTSLETQIATICERVHRTVPQLKLFNLGPDHILLERFLTESSSGKWEHHIKIESMDASQQELLRELVRTKNKGLHRFLLADRSDPGKGLAAYLDAVRVFLTDLPEEKRREYRFFGIHDLIDLPPVDTYDVKQQYIRLVQERYKALQRDFPGIVFACKSISKEALLFAADQDCYPVTAAADDGLNLVGQEMTKINARRYRSRPTIFARGAGFTKETLRRGGEGLMLTPEPGNVQSMLACLREAVRLYTEEPAAARAMITELTDRFIDTRTDSVVVDQ